MPTNDRVIRILGRIGILFCLFLTGCIPIPYTYPTISYVPPINTQVAGDEVYAVRVDVAERHNCVEFPEDDSYVLNRVSLWRAGSVLPQAQLSLDYGWVWHMIALSYGQHTHHTVMVRLYRPGWKTVEIKSWQKTGQVTWIEANDLVEREKAVDELLSTWETDLSGQLSRRMELRAKDQRDDTISGQDEEGKPPKGPGRFRCLAPGSASRKHREVVLFAASEYDRLATNADEATRRRLNAKAQWLREKAK